MSHRVHYDMRASAFSRRMLTFAIVNDEHIDIRDFLTDSFNIFDHEITRIIKDHFIVKLSACFVAVFEKSVQGECELKEKQSIYIQTRSEIIDLDTNLVEFYNNEIVKYVLSQIDEVVMEGSGFSLSEINELVIQVNRYEPFRASSYIELSKNLMMKKAIVNVNNHDEMCFKWAILSALYPALWNPSRLMHYLEYQNELDFTGIDFPVKLTQIDKFERLNPSISINVYFYDERDKKVTPLRVTKTVKMRHIHLLLAVKLVKLAGSSEPQVQSHYCWIKNLSRLVSSQVWNHKGMHFFCDRCLNFFQRLQFLEKHRENCMQQNEFAIEMPVEGTDIIKFTNRRHQQESAFIVYADVEALLKKTHQTVLPEHVNDSISGA